MGIDNYQVTLLTLLRILVSKSNKMKFITKNSSHHLLWEIKINRIVHIIINSITKIKIIIWLLYWIGNNVVRGFNSWID